MYLCSGVVKVQHLNSVVSAHSERWRALSPEEKKKYEDMAAEDKIRFQMEMQHYQATHGGDTSEFYDAAMEYDGYGESAQHDPYAVQSDPIHSQYHG